MPELTFFHQAKITLFSLFLQFIHFNFLFKNNITGIQDEQLTVTETQKTTQSKPPKLNHRSASTDDLKSDQSVVVQPAVKLHKIHSSTCGSDGQRTLHSSESQKNVTLTSRKHTICVPTTSKPSSSKKSKLISNTPPIHLRKPSTDSDAAVVPSCRQEKEYFRQQKERSEEIHQNHRLEVLADVHYGAEENCNRQSNIPAHKEGTKLLLHFILSLENSI